MNDIQFKVKKYCVEYIINKTYMSTSKSKVEHVDFPKLRFTYINKNLDTKKKLKMQTLLNKLIQLS